jgi:arylsulfatase A-like enzyme
MKTKHILIFGLIVAVSGAIYFAFSRRGSTQRKDFNLIILSVDTCRADFLSPYGNVAVSTPNLDRLAKEGTVFDHHYTTVNTTLAAHSSILTGLYPRNHGVGRNFMHLSEKNLTLTEVLHAKGYTTAAFIGAFPLASLFGFNQGFDFYDEAFLGDVKQLRQEELESLEDEVPIRSGKNFHNERRAELVNASFFQWLERNKQKKFFAFLHYYDPHFPYKPPRQWYKKRFAEIPTSTPVRQQLRTDFLAASRPYITQVDPFDPNKIESYDWPESLKALIYLYASEIEYVDHSVGQIIRKLDETNLRRRTILIVTGDHGENLVEHPEFDSFFRHGLLAYDTETRVPLFMSSPGFLPEGKRVNEITSHVDLLPTVLDLLSLDPVKSDGISLRKTIFSDKKLPRMIFGESSRPNFDLQRAAKEKIWVNDQNSTFVRAGAYKYIDIPRMRYKAIFNLTDDPWERVNLIEQVNAKLTADMNQELKTWRSKTTFVNIDTKFELGQEELERLKSLGYVQ